MSAQCSLEIFDVFDQFVTSIYVLLEFMELILKNLLTISEFNQPTINHLSQVSIQPFSEIEKRN